MVRPPGRPLRQRHRLGAAPSQVDGGHRGRLPAWRALVLQATFGGSSFLPQSDVGTIAIDVRTPVEREPRVREAQGREGRGARAHDSRDRGHQQPASTPAAGACTWTSARATSATARPARSPRSCASSLTRLVGAEYVVLDDLNNGAQKPVQIQFSGPDSRRLMAITSDFMEKMKKIPGAVDVGLSEQDPKDELQDRARPRARQSARHLGGRRGAGAARGVRRRRGRRLGRSRSANRATSRCGCIPTTASTPPTSSTCRSRSAAAT